ncbi:acyl-CoA-binding domain-containing protein 4 isoform X3 [Haemorhous mexicanus]|nr:acyl-CoA-binding domain-containing protein 4 isoform X3 [Haemorhous mexicanus]
MLRFYSYYKQATAGRCQGPRPGFWDPIGRYKWDAWHSLGTMSKEEAMAAYVAEMKKVAQKVIDTVPMDESTEEMFRYFEPLYEVIHDMPRPPESFFRSRGESQGQQDGPGQDGRESSPAPESPRDTLPGQQQHGQHVPGPGLAPAPEALEGSQVTSDSEGDTFSDTLEQMEPEKAGQVRGLTPKGVQAGAEPPEPHSAGQGEWGEGRRAEGSSTTDLPALGSETGGGSWDRPWPGTRSTGLVPVAPDRVPAHTALLGHLALRHPVAAAPLAGQEEVTPEHASPPPPPPLLAIPLRTEPRGNRLSSHRARPGNRHRHSGPAPATTPPPRTDGAGAAPGPSRPPGPLGHHRTCLN